MARHLAKVQAIRRRRSASVCFWFFRLVFWPLVVSPLVASPLVVSPLFVSPLVLSCENLARRRAYPTAPEPPPEILMQTSPAQRPEN